MSPPLIHGTLSVLCNSVTAMLPMRVQMIPGLTLIAAAVLFIWIGILSGYVWVTFGMYCFVSVFRRPLHYFARKALGLTLPGLPLEPLSKSITDEAVK